MPLFYTWTFGISIRIVCVQLFVNIFICLVWERERERDSHFANTDLTGFLLFQRMEMRIEKSTSIKKTNIKNNYKGWINNPFYRANNCNSYCCFHENDERTKHHLNNTLNPWRMWVLERIVQYFFSEIICTMYNANEYVVWCV